MVLPPGRQRMGGADNMKTSTTTRPVGLFIIRALTGTTGLRLKSGIWRPVPIITLFKRFKRVTLRDDALLVFVVMDPVGFQ
jgi:hypothetical protein